MSTTLTYGYKKPQDGDTGATFWDDLAFDIQRLNDHTHDGSDSAQLDSTSIAATTATISSASWVLTSGGTYRQVVTMPPGLDFDSYGKSFMINSGASAGHDVTLSIEKITNTTFYVYINDNTVDLLVRYLV